jgi:hypothetical protein
MTDKEFVPGLFAKAPHENSPDFVKMGLTIKVKDLGNFLREKNQAGEEWVNIQVKESQGGKWYAEVDNWKPDANRQQNDAPAPSQQQAEQEDFDDDIPF